MIREDLKVNFKFHRKFLSILIFGSALLFSGCGTTLTNEDAGNDAPVNKSASLDVEKESMELTDETTSTDNTTMSTAKEGSTGKFPVTLISTTDGDTIRVMYKGVNEPVRYLLIDTPETNHPRLGKQPFGPAAKERNKTLVTSGKLTLEFDVGEKRDKYGRLLAYVYVDGKSVQETLIREGLARVAYVYPPNTRHLTPYQEAQKEAQSKELGFWAVENYATDSGFANIRPTSSDSNSNNEPSTTTDTKEWFDNCTHLRTKYPDGVGSDHPAYQAKMDRDQDNFACE